jgi:class 3 adenylate cyclase
MFCDVSDYTGVTERLGDAAAHQLLREYAGTVRRLVADSRGHVLKSTGDGLMVGFTGVTAALRCAIAIQNTFATRNLDGSLEPIRVHIGVHVGEVVRDGDDLLGMAVNVASRLADAAETDEILVSAVARELAAGSRDFGFDDPRLVPLKGLSDPREAYPLRWHQRDEVPLPRLAQPTGDDSSRETA